MFSFSTAGSWVPKPPEPCSACGAQVGADHAEDCNVLAAMRVQAYPQVIDRNGMPWYMNALAKRDAEIVRLKKVVEEQDG